MTPGNGKKADDYLRRTQTLASTDAAAVMIQVMYARLAFARNDHDAALRHADACLAFASPINDSHGRTLWRDYYITPIFRRHGRVEQAFALVTDALRYSHNGRNSFLSARFCAVLAELWEETGDLNKAGIALYAAQRIHAELGSRSATKSMGLWLRFRQRTASDASLATLWESIVPLPWETLVALLLEDM